MTTFFFIFILFLAIENPPIFAKLLLPKDEYDFKFEDAEHEVKTSTAQKGHQRNVILEADNAINDKSIWWHC